MTNENTCPLLGTCGGCSYIEESYQQQITLKKEKIQTLFSSIYADDIPFHPAKNLLGYRSRMDFVFCSINKPVEFGLRKANKSFFCVPLITCPLLPQEGNEILKQIQGLFDNCTLPVYNLKSRKGFLRYLTIRYSSTNEALILITTSKPSDDQESSFLFLLEQILQVTNVVSVQWSIAENSGDDVGYAKPIKVLGKNIISEHLLGVNFSIGPHTFFQSNKDVAEVMFAKIAKNVSGSVLDVCCGIGAISLIVKKLHPSSVVLGVEQFDESIIAAKENAKSNTLDVDFITKDASVFLKEQALNKNVFDTIILDPPRIGLTPQIMRILPRLKPKKIIYMSCNPASLRSDIEPLLRKYAISFLEAYDMFPQTAHVEMICVLTPLNS